MRDAKQMAMLAVTGWLGMTGSGLAAGDLVPAGAVADAVVGYNAGPDLLRYRAVLVETDGAADLYLFADMGEGWTKAAFAPAIVWRGLMAGTDPSLEVADNGSLKVMSENSSIGRDRWTQTLTIAYRGGGFVVAGYTFSYYDTLDPDAGGICDVNLLSGRGTHKDAAFKTGFAARSVSAWTMDTMPPECRR